MIDPLDEQVLLQENLRLVEQLQNELAERARTEAELRASQQKYRMLAENMQDVVWVMDPLAGRFLYVSPSVQALRGYTAEEVMAQPASAALTEESARRVQSVMAQGYAAFRAGKRTADNYDTSEVEQPCKDGSTVWTEAVTHYVLDEATGRVIVHGVTRDITERKRAVDVLRASEERYRLLTTLSPDGIIVADQTGRIWACNEQFAHMHGFANSAEMVGRNAQGLATPEAFTALYNEIAAVFARGESVMRDLEVEVLRRDGAPFFAEYSVATVPWPDAPFGVAYLCNVRDITKRKEAAAELAQYRSHLEELVAARTAELQAEIAQRAAAQAALQRSHQLLVEAERIARVGSWEADLVTGELYVSDGICRILGIDPGASPQAIYAAAWEFMRPDDVPLARAELARAQATGAPLDIVVRLVRPAGETLVFRVRAEFERDAAGRPEFVRGMAQDITEQERTKTALDRRVQELSILQQLGHTISFSLSLDEIIRTHLGRLVSLAGLDLAQVYLLQGDRLRPAGVCTRVQQSSGLLPRNPEDCATVARILEDRAQDLAVGECLCGLAAQTGQTLYAAEAESDPRCTPADCRVPDLHTLAALPLRSGEGIIGVLMAGAAAPDAFGSRLGFLEAIAGLFGARLQNTLLYQEIRERAAGLEEAVSERTLELQTERDRTQAILETVGESVVVTDLDGQVLFANPATEALSGFSRDELSGQPLWRRWSAQALKDAWPAAQGALRRGEAWRGEISGRRKDGETYICAATAVPLYDANEPPGPVGAVWVQRDITALKEAARLKDQFVSNVSHELRTPISIIALSCDNLEAYRDRLDEAQRWQIIQDIHDQAHLLDRLVDDILMVSQLDSGQLTASRSQVDLARVLREEVKRQQPLAEKRSQHIAVSAAAPAPVLGNEGQLRQIVRNLLDNAIKYTPAGGVVRCACEARPGAGAPAHAGAAAWAVLEFVDSGIGIAPEDLPCLFERFFRVNRESDTPGTGLGLPIAQDLVQLHGGWIDVASTPGQGSTFTVYLPLAG